MHGTMASLIAVVPHARRRTLMAKGSLCRWDVRFRDDLSSLMFPVWIAHDYAIICTE